MLIRPQIRVLQQLQHVQRIPPHRFKQIVNKARLVLHDVLDNLLYIVLNPLHICLDPSVRIHKHSCLDQTVQIKQPIYRSYTLSSHRNHVAYYFSKYVVEHIRHHDLQLLLFMELVKVINVLLDLVILLLRLFFDHTGVFNFFV